MMVARDGVEPPTPAFSVFFEPKPFFIQQLNSSRWPSYCDHSVTSADVRLSVGPNLSRAACQRPGDLASLRRGLGTINTQLLDYFRLARHPPSIEGEQAPT